MPLFFKRIQKRTSVLTSIVSSENYLLSRIHNLWWEFKLGITTNGLVQILYPDAHPYASFRYLTIHRILDFLNLDKSDILVDIGSGKGRVVCSAARFELKSVVGIELSKPLCDLSNANIARLKGRKSDIVVHNIPAQEFDFANGTVYILFNPFGESTLLEVLHRMERSLKHHPREFRIVYVNPEHGYVLDQTAWLERYESWPEDEQTNEHSVLFYRTCNHS